MKKKREKSAEGAAVQIEATETTTGNPSVTDSMEEFLAVLADPDPFGASDVEVRGAEPHATSRTEKETQNETEGSDEAVSIVLKSNDTVAQVVSTSVERALATVREEWDALEARVFRELLPIADALAEAKRCYERTTNTGHGKRNSARLPSFNHLTAQYLGRSVTAVERLIRISTLDTATRELLSTSRELRANQDALLALAKTEDVNRRHRAIEAFSSEGRSGFDKALRPEVGREPFSEPATHAPSAETPVIRRAQLSPEDSAGSAVPTSLPITVALSGTPVIVEIPGGTYAVTVDDADNEGPKVRLAPR